VIAAAVVIGGLFITAAQWELLWCRDGKTTTSALGSKLSAHSPSPRRSWQYWLLYWLDLKKRGVTDYDLDSGDCLLGQIVDATIHVTVVSFGSVNVPGEQKTKAVEKIIGCVPVLANRVATKIIQLDSDCNVRHLVLPWSQRCQSLPLFSHILASNKGATRNWPVTPRREDETWQIIISFAIVAALLIIMMTCWREADLSLAASCTATRSPQLSWIAVCWGVAALWSVPKLGTALV
jgi:hypothetical protein